MKRRGVRPSVAKIGGYWRWECHERCPAGGTGYRTQQAAFDALRKHAGSHASFGFQRVAS